MTEITAAIAGVMDGMAGETDGRRCGFGGFAVVSHDSDKNHAQKNMPNSQFSPLKYAAIRVSEMIKMNVKMVAITIGSCSPGRQVACSRRALLGNHGKRRKSIPPITARFISCLL
jgi:hypothetical protein